MSDTGNVYYAYNGIQNQLWDWPRCTSIRLKRMYATWATVLQFTVPHREQQNPQALSLHIFAWVRLPVMRDRSTSLIRTENWHKRRSPLKAFHLKICPWEPNLTRSKIHHPEKGFSSPAPWEEGGEVSNEMNGKQTCSWITALKKIWMTRAKKDTTPTSNKKCVSASMYKF